MSRVVVVLYWHIGEKPCHPNVIGLGMGLGLAILLTSAIGLAQDRPAAQPAVQGHVDVFNSIQGRMVVMSSRSDGAPVEKGDIVCELDPRELKDRLATQDIVVRAAEFDLESAAMAREATGMRIVEYVEGQLKNVLATIAGEIKVAEANLSIAEDQLDWARRMFDKGYVSLAEKVTNELQLKEARFGARGRPNPGKRYCWITRRNERSSSSGVRQRRPWCASWRCRRPSSGSVRPGKA